VKWHEEYGEKLDLNKYKKEFTLKVLASVQERMKTLNEFNDLTYYFYSKPLIDKEKLSAFSGSLDKAKEIVTKYLDFYKEISDENWTKEYLDKVSHEKLIDFGYKPKEAFMTLRYATCGVEFTPGLFDVFNLIGKKEILERLEAVLK
jgi:glutamyl/glutaminyl-tRNA synthetase